MENKIVKGRRDKMRGGRGGEEEVGKETAGYVRNTVNPRDSGG